MTGERALGVLLLVGGRAARGGWVCVLVFQLLLVRFDCGFGFGLWSVPALARLAYLASRDLKEAG